MNLIDFHVHGKGSFFKDKHANASYDDMCSYFQGIAEEEDKDVVVAFTEHDNVALTYDEYKKLSKKYPRVKIVLGIECNTKLSYSTNELFEQAHVLVYADMSSDESVKKWFDCKELQALSKLNTFKVKFPSPYMRSKTYVENFNNTFGMKLNYSKIAEAFEKYPIANNIEKFGKDFVEYIATELYENIEYYSERGGYFYRSILDKKYNSNDISKIKFEDIVEKLNSFCTNVLNGQSSNKLLGNSLYVAKNILGKYLKLKISNIEYAMILDGAKSYEQMRNEFLKLTRYKIQKHNPELYNKIKDLSLNEFANYGLGDGGYGKIILNNFFPRNMSDLWAIESNNVADGVRTRLSELNTIAQKTGGYLMLAHPNSKFTYKNGTIFTKNDFQFITANIFSKSKYTKLKTQIKNNKSMPMDGIKTYKNGLLKLDLFMNICKKNGINFTGFEITKDDLANKYKLINKLIYAAKNGYEISFGSDTHLSKCTKYYNLYKQNKISQNQLNKLVFKLADRDDKIAKTKEFKNLYAQNFKKLLNLTNCEGFCHKIDKSILKNHPEEPIYAAKEYNRVIGTSFADKLLNQNQDVENKPLFVLNIKDKIYSFNKNDLMKMNYLKDTDNKDSDNNLKEEL